MRPMNSNFGNHPSPPAWMGPQDPRFQRYRPPQFGPDQAFGGWGAHPRPRRGRARRGEVRNAILALLLEGSLNGYQIMQTLAQRTQGAWKPSPGAVYPALNALVDEGLISETEAGDKKAYQLTEAGQEAAQQAAKSQPRPEPASPSLSGLDDGLAQLSLAIQAICQTENELVISRAGEVIDQARRQLHAILAEEPPTDQA